MQDEIGSAAGVVWEFLDRQGETVLVTLKDRTGLSEEILFMALGWLAREEKVNLLKEGRTIRISLTNP
jgi:Winged helix-turn-helix domain (DUF2582)